MHRKLILVACLLAAPAHVRAGVSFVLGCEDGQCATTRTWDVTYGTATVRANAVVPTNGEIGNNWSLEFPALTGRGKDITSTTELTMAALLRVQTLPAGECVIAETLNGASRQCFVTLSSDGRLRAYYGDTTTECAQSTNDGQTCTDAAGCSEVNPGEATCSEATFARSGVLTTGAWHQFALTQDASQANPGDAACGLWVDGVQRGTRVRPQGTCSGSSPAGEVCSTHADCTSNGGTCTFTNTTTTRLWWGPRACGGSIVVQMDNFTADPVAVNSALAFSRLHDVHPNGEVVGDWDGTVGDAACTSDYQCVDDTTGTGTVDGTATEIQTSSNGTQSVWDLEDTTLDVGEAVLAASLFCSARETNDNSNNSGKTITLGIRDQAGSPNVLMGTAYDLTAEAGGGESHRSGPASVFATEPDGTAWDGEADVDALRFRLLYSGSSGTGYRVRATDCVAEVLLSKPLPAVPDELYDWNGDGEETVCYVGDSRFSDAALETAVTEALEEPDNVVRCASGGRRAADVAQDWTAILNGVGGSRVPCVALKGQAAKCDYAILDIGVNDFGTHPNYPENGRCYQSVCVGGSNDANGCAVASDCPGGACGGPQHGDPCSHPNGRAIEQIDSGVASAYCALGASFKSKTLHAPPTPCLLASQCAGGPTTGNAGACSLDGAIGTWCLYGSLDSPACPNGLCVRVNSLTYLERQFHGLIQAAQARTGANRVQLILVKPYPTTRKTITSGVLCIFSKTKPYMARQRALVTDLAAQYGLDTIDLTEAFRQLCPSRDYELCLRDTVHPSTAATPGLTPGVSGDDVITRAFEACLEADGAATYVDCQRLVPTATP